MKRLKFIVIGLGHFGSDLAERLTAMGHEVIGVDKSMNRVESYKNTITRTICLQTTNQASISNLPIKEADVVLICIGSNEGENILSTALVKKMNAKKIVSRSMSPLHENVLEAMGVDDIIRPEVEAAAKWTLKLSSQNYLNLFEITKDHRIVELVVPQSLENKSLKELGLNVKYNVLVLTKLRWKDEENPLGKATKVLVAGEIVNAETMLDKNDIIVVYGNKEDIQRLVAENE